MKVFLILSSFFIHSFCSSQVFHTQKTKLDENPIATFQDKFGYYISCGRTTSVDTYYSSIIKLSEKGELIKKIEFLGNNVSSYLGMGIEVDDGYIFLGSCQKANGFSYFYLIKTDYDLNIIQQKTFGDEGCISQYFNSFYIKNNDTIVLSGIVYKSDTPILLYNGCIFEINKELNILKSKIFDDANYNDIYSILPLPDDSGYKITSSAFNNFSDPTSGIIISNIDNNFNVTSIKKIKKFIPTNNNNNISWQCGDIHKLNDSIYVMGTQTYYDRTPNTIPVSTLENYDVNTLYLKYINDSIYYFNILGKEDSSDFANYINVSVLNDSVVYSAGTHRITNSFMENKETTWLMLNKQKYTSTGIVTEWEYFYGGDARYRHTHVLATKDGGCLITARRYDTTGFFLSDVFFLKIQEDGTPYPVGGINKTKKSIAITLSPNPASDIITSAFPENTYKEIGIINIQGEIIFKQDLQSNLSHFKINVNSFSSGTYSIYFKEKETGFGIAKKIIIQH